MWLMQAPRGWHHDGMFMGGHWLWWLFWIAVALLAVWAFVKLVRDERPRDREEPRREDAEEILRRRLSEGEIDEDEFRRRMRLLRESDSPEDDRSSGD